MCCQAFGVINASIIAPVATDLDMLLVAKIETCAVRQNSATYRALSAWCEPHRRFGCVILIVRLSSRRGFGVDIISNCIGSTSFGERPIFSSRVKTERRGWLYGRYWQTAIVGIVSRIDRL